LMLRLRRPLRRPCLLPTKEPSEESHSGFSL
jgi:hypothetical protein